MNQGLLIVNTGSGKGKTTAALGAALRAAGTGMNVCIIQFLKGSWKYGELESLKKIPEIEILQMGTGFTWEKESLDEDRQLARIAWDTCREAALSGKYGMVIFDEINYVLHYGLLDTQEVLDFLRDRPDGLHIIMTGRNAPEPVQELADMVTEMREVKHHFKKGVKAQKGIEY
jgi:cob(I)alamin adenosyltransferase